MKILIIDNDVDVLTLLSNVLADLGQVISTEGGIQRLAPAAKWLPDLVICDVVMPDVDGLAVCRHLKTDVLTKNIPIACISACLDSEEEELAALEAGAVDFIKKPISPLIVRARIKIQVELCLKSELLLDMARRDPLTGIFNRRYFDERLSDEWARHRRNQEPLAVALVDVDDFKAFNDHYGHVKAMSA